MQVFDASSMIYAWDNYPKDLFPPLWDWLASQIQAGNLQIPEVAHDEITYKVPDCADWLSAQGLEPMEITNEIVQQAVAIKTILGIANDEYHPKGVDENDVLVIAAAKQTQIVLVSNESPQPKRPDEHRKLKIPAVCKLDGVDVECINFLEYIKRSQAVFG